MPLTAEIAAQQIKDRLRSLQGLIHDIDNERRRTEPNIQQLLRTKDKLAAAAAAAGDGDAPRPAAQQQLKRLYKLGLSDAAAEEALIRQALAKVHEIRAIRNECRQQASRAGAGKGEQHRGALTKRLEMAAHALPLFVGKPGERIPALCGAVPADAGYVAKPGDMVAALLKHSVDEDNCITAVVVAFLPAQNKYELDDIDEEVVTRYVVARSRVVPLPLMRANPETEPSALFACGTTVSAIYPQSSCFYKAKVVQVPRTAADKYELTFEDEAYPTGYSPPLRVPQRYVIAFKPPTKKSAGSSS